MATALDRITVKDVILGIGSIFGFIMFLSWSRDMVSYSSMSAPGKQSDASTYKRTGIPAMFTPKTRVTLDTRGITDISSLAGTAPLQGLWGGKDNSLHVADQSFQRSNTLFGREGTYHPWSDFHRHEVRDQAFNIIYSSRVHQ